MALTLLAVTSLQAVSLEQVACEVFAAVTQWLKDSIQEALETHSRNSAFRLTRSLMALVLQRVQGLQTLKHLVSIGEETGRYARINCPSGAS